jgi:hypothetical protein
MRTADRPVSTTKALTGVLVALGPWEQEQRARAERVVRSMILRHPIASDVDFAPEVTRLAKFLSGVDLTALSVDLSALEGVSRQIFEALLADLQDDPRARLMWALGPSATTPAS